ncbi:MAG: thioredoxin [Gammaproteobacteria bacterium]|nr:thioredoxin [Gammaproteobacteria bacterium]
MPELIHPTGLASFEQDVLEASRTLPVIVDFWAAWCGPCKTLGPILENVARSLAGRARILKVDTDAEQALAGQFQIRSIPTVLLFRDGRLAAQFVGVRPEAAIRDWIAPFLPLETTALRTEATAARARGDLDTARTLLAKALAAHPDDHDSREDLAELELAAGNATAARSHLGELPESRRMDDRARGLDARLYFLDELDTAGKASSDLDTLYAEGLRAAARGAYRPAAEAFIALTERSRAYRDDAGREALLRLFQVLGSDDELVPEFRRRLARLLH